jgi:hypothetical protein
MTEESGFDSQKGQDFSLLYPASCLVGTCKLRLIRGWYQRMWNEAVMLSWQAYFHPSNRHSGFLLIISSSRFSSLRAELPSPRKFQQVFLADIYRCIRQCLFSTRRLVECTLFIFVKLKGFLEQLCVPRPLDKLNLENQTWQPLVTLLIQPPLWGASRYFVCKNHCYQHKTVRIRGDVNLSGHTNAARKKGQWREIHAVVTISNKLIKPGVTNWICLPLRDFVCVPVVNIIVEVKFLTKWTELKLHMWKDPGWNLDPGTNRSNSLICSLLSPFWKEKGL